MADNKVTENEFDLKGSTFVPTSTPVRMGIDVGSTTVKVVVLDENDEFIYSEYERHRADIRSTIIAVVGRALDTIQEKCADGEKQKIIIRIQKNALMEIEDGLGSESIFVKDERYYAKAFLQCDDNLLSKLFSLGNQVTVIKPDELKTKLVKHAQNVIMNYSKRAGG